MSALTVIEEYFTIRSNASFTSFDGLENLEHVEQLTILTSPALRSLRDFERLSRVGSLYITNNPVLPTCEAEWLRDHIGISNISGIVSIRDNDDSGTCQ